MNIALHDVKRVIIEKPFNCHTSTCREVVIELENGTQVTIEIFYKDETLKLEIN